MKVEVEVFWYKQALMRNESSFSDLKWSKHPYMLLL